MRDVYICDFVIAMKLTQMGLQQLYIDPLVKYLNYDFMSFNNVFDQTSYQIKLQQLTNLTIGVKFSIYYFSNHQYLLHIRGITIKIFMPILKVFLKMVVNWVKTQCKFFAKGLTNELVMWFFNSYMMNVLGVKSILNIGYNLKLIIFFPCIYLLGLYNITHYW